ncbi:hypothetical protein KL933_004527 [Ogataea haglerorum]|uniref:Uncharacterized protein n=1 Tax=Ogataea haglerorum TaxID=1937702 RepID=A0AAN6HYY7_9ASCO|nr:hypothetical protein KL933_004527 [Ogataea haglerorum]KAG7727904.1 hypothetical protein KL948_004431 [Ogataea haglerorum]KAG7784718.1 hypothetical protein KL945_004356 [Ogataea haglerorum]KAG7785137.1 hypothetical protein KL910_004971 [Ogataea haglerorum]
MSSSLPTGFVHLPISSALTSLFIAQMAPILAFCPVPDAVPERVAGHPVRHADGAQPEESGARFWKLKVFEDRLVSLHLQRCRRRSSHVDTLHIYRH